MTPAEQDIAIAEVCGWSGVHLYEDNAGPPIWTGIPPVSFPCREDQRRYGTKIPDYVSDLNAMHDAEDHLTGSQWTDYGIRLERNYRNFPKWKEMNCSVAVNIGLIHATASQRAEAFLRTVGKWRGE